MRQPHPLENFLFNISPGVGRFLSLQLANAYDADDETDPFE